MERRIKPFQSKPGQSEPWKTPTPWNRKKQRRCRICGVELNEFNTSRIDGMICIYCEKAENDELKILYSDEDYEDEDDDYQNRIRLECRCGYAYEGDVIFAPDNCPQCGRKLRQAH